MGCPVYRWRDSNPGLELGNSSCHAKGKPYKCETRRGKVPMGMVPVHIPLNASYNIEITGYSRAQPEAFKLACLKYSYASSNTKEIDKYRYWVAWQQWLE